MIVHMKIYNTIFMSLKRSTKEWNVPEKVSLFLTVTQKKEWKNGYHDKMVTRGS